MIQATTIGRARGSDGGTLRSPWPAPGRTATVKSLPCFFSAFRIAIDRSAGVPRDLVGEPAPVDADEWRDLVTRGGVPEPLERLEPGIDSGPDGVDEGPVEVEDDGRRTRNLGGRNRRRTPNWCRFG